MEPTPINPVNPQKKPAAAPVDMATAHYAGFWMRFLAYIIDAILLGIVTNLLFGNSAASMQDGVYTVNYSGWNTLLPIAYFVGFWIALSATPGALALGLKIVDANGAKISPVTAIVRFLGFMLSAIVLCIGFIWIAFDPKKQGWHDKIAKTFMVRKR